MATKISTNQRRGMVGAPRKQRVQFDGPTLEKIADDLRSDRIPLPRVSVSDDQQVYLRAIIRNTGLISFHVQYETPEGGRPYFKIGDYPNMTVKKAREIAKTILALSAKGIDPQDGMRERLIRELEERGEKWRP